MAMAERKQMMLVKGRLLSSKGSTPLLNVQLIIRCWIFKLFQEKKKMQDLEKKIRKELEKKLKANSYQKQIQQEVVPRFEIC